MDWVARDDIRAKLRTIIRRLLAKYKYPPDAEAKAIELIIRQMETFAEDWATVVPERLEAAREHIAGRMESEHRLLTKVRESPEAEDQQVTAAAARIAGLLAARARQRI